MIWDVLDCIEENDISKYRKVNWHTYSSIDDIVDMWEYKRKPIEEQNEECIDYIFDLINNNQ
jgi:hypothetical protein